MIFCQSGDLSSHISHVFGMNPGLSSRVSLRFQQDPRFSLSAYLPRSSLSSKKHGSGVYIPLGRDLILMILVGGRFDLKTEMGVDFPRPIFVTFVTSHSWLGSFKEASLGVCIQLAWATYVQRPTGGEDMSDKIGRGQGIDSVPCTRPPYPPTPGTTRRLRRSGKLTKTSR